MAAGHIYSTRFDTTTLKAKDVKRIVTGVYMDSITLTIPTTAIDDINDHANFLPVPPGLVLRGAHIEVGALAASLLDMDLILRDPSAALTDAPNATLLNAGTLFAAAVSKYFAFATPVTVPRFTLGYGIVGFVVNAAAGTPAEMDLTLTLWGTAA